jgi:hypothetical protein
LTSASTAGRWKSTANTHPVSAPMSSAGKAGMRITTSPITSAAGSSRCGPMAKRSRSAVVIPSSCAVSVGAGIVSPTTAKSTSASTMLGMVVHSMWRMCVNRSVPATAGARFVVSDSGESLSPK